MVLESDQTGHQNSAYEAVVFCNMHRPQHCRRHFQDLFVASKHSASTGIAGVVDSSITSSGQALLAHLNTGASASLGPQPTISSGRAKITRAASPDRSLGCHVISGTSMRRAFASFDASPAVPHRCKTAHMQVHMVLYML